MHEQRRRRTMKKFVDILGKLRLSLELHEMTNLCNIAYLWIREQGKAAFVAKYSSCLGFTVVEAKVLRRSSRASERSSYRDRLFFWIRWVWCSIVGSFRGDYLFRHRPIVKATFTGNTCNFKMSAGDIDSCSLQQPACTAGASK